MDIPAQRVAALEPIGQVQWTRRGCQDTAVVVGCKRLESARCEVADEGYKACAERVGGECYLSESPTSWYAHRLQAY
jgi:hypothetical protein